MKLAAIYNVFDGVELLRGSMNTLKYHVDLFIIVWQDVSNYNEYFNPMPFIDVSGIKTVVFHKYNPIIPSNGTSNERNKRNIGLELAKSHGCTHFMHVDVDEYYQDFGKAKQLYEEMGFNGSVCKLFTYFKTPTLRFETPDEYYVPFIHALKPDSMAGYSLEPYPFYVDPTRRINETNVVELPDTFMHHYSWVRKDITMKVRNSSAKKNFERTSLLHDYFDHGIKEGSIVKDYHGKKLITVENTFNIEI